MEYKNINEFLEDFEIKEKMRTSRKEFLEVTISTYENLKDQSYSHFEICSIMKKSMNRLIKKHGIAIDSVLYDTIDGLIDYWLQELYLEGKIDDKA